MPKHKRRLTRAQLARSAVPAVPSLADALKPSEVRERQFAQAVRMQVDPAEETYVPYKNLPDHGITYSKPTIISMVKEGRFPQPFTHGLRKKVWKLADINRWKATRPAWKTVRPAHLGPKAQP